MSKVRINDLARELEVKSKAILDALSKVGVTEKKTHSSSIEEHEAEKVRLHIRSSFEGHAQAARSSLPLRGEEEIKTNVDLSRISAAWQMLLKQSRRNSRLYRLPAGPVTTRQRGHECELYPDSRYTADRSFPRQR